MEVRLVERARAGDHAAFRELIDVASPRCYGTTGPGRGYLWIRPGLAGSNDNRHGNFYLWAALIRDGQLVSVDYAPDVGWLTAPDDPVPSSPSP